MPVFSHQAAPEVQPSIVLEREALPGSALALSSLQTLCLDEQSSVGTESSVLLWVSLFSTMVNFHQAERKPKLCCCQHRQHRWNEALHLCAHMHLWLKCQCVAVELGKSRRYEAGLGSCCCTQGDKISHSKLCLLQSLEEISLVISTNNFKKRL